MSRAHNSQKPNFQPDPAAKAAFTKKQVADFDPAPKGKKSAQERREDQESRKAGF